jgi:DEAD/DEAH box helicase domain-containing protein
LALKNEVVEKMRQENKWYSDPNDYGPTWEKQRNLARLRDQYRCSLCGVAEGEKPHHVHHKIPFRLFSNPIIANDLSNLVTLCPNCHRLVELNVKIRSAISGLNYALYHLSPLLVMCDENDLGSFADPAADFADKKPVILIYDAIPAGMGLTQMLYKQHRSLLINAKELIDQCECLDGCPSCVGPISEAGIGGKKETAYLLSLLLKGDPS